VSADYDIFIASDIDSDSLLRIVEDALGLDHFRDPEYRSEHNPSVVGRWAPGFILTAHAVHPMSAEIRGEWLGFRPQVSVCFRWDKEEDWSISYRRILRAASAVLERLPDDAALVLNGESGILIRRGDRVIVSDEPRVFDAEDLAEIRVPYELGKVPTAADAP
jgi:hypothetical protein